MTSEDTHPFILHLSDPSYLCARCMKRWDAVDGRAQYSLAVWHCPKCDHHWSDDDDQCGNCYRARGKRDVLATAFDPKEPLRGDPRRPPTMSDPELLELLAPLNTFDLVRLRDLARDELERQEDDWRVAVHLPARERGYRKWSERHEDWPLRKMP